MRFDVSITTCDRERMLTACVESALAQTAAGVRVRVVDNASETTTREAVAHFGEGVSYERLAPRVPFQDCLTRAQELIEAPCGMVLHDDDLLDVNYVETALDAFERHPDVGMVVFHVRPIAAEGFPVPELASPYRWASVYGHARTGAGPAGPEILLPPGALPATVARLPWTSPYWPSISLRSDAFQSAGPFDAELGMLTDVDMWLRVGAAHPVLLVDAVRCSYRFHAGSMTTEQDASHGDVFMRDVVRMYEKERAGDAGWSWTDEEACAWLSYALQRSIHGGGREEDFEEYGLGRCGATLAELERHHLRAWAWRRQALGGPAWRRPVDAIVARLRRAGWLDE